MKDINSPLYEVAAALPDAGPLYGCDCSGFVSYSWRIEKQGTATFANCSECTRLTSATATSLRAGDALVKAKNHCILIKSINSSSVIVWEQTPPIVKETQYTISAFTNKYLNNGYLPYRLNTVTLTFNSNGGSAVVPTALIAVPNFTLGNVTLPTPTRSNYAFTGWYTKATGGTKVTSNYEITSNATFYAHWIMESVAPNSIFIIPQAITLSDMEKRNLSY